MSEAGWFAIVTLIVGAANSAFLVWIKYKQGTTETKQNTLETKQNALLDSNQKQNVKLAEIHTDINGRVAESVSAQVRLHIDEAVNAAVKKALSEERARVEKEK